MYQHTMAFCKALGVGKDVGTDGINHDRMVESFKVVEGEASEAEKKESNDKDINPCPGKRRFHVNVIS